MGIGVAPIQPRDPDANQPLGFSVFEGSKPVCQECAALVPAGGVDLRSILDGLGSGGRRSIGGYGGGEGAAGERPGTTPGYPFPLPGGSRRGDLAGTGGCHNSRPSGVISGFPS